MFSPKRTITIIAPLLIITSITLFFSIGCAGMEKKPTEKTVETERAALEAEEAESKEAPLPEPVITDVTLANGAESARTGEQITISVGGENYDSLQFKFYPDAEFIEASSHTYIRFGVKTIDIKASNRDNEVYVQFSLPIIGTATVNVDKQEVEHSKNLDKNLEDGIITFIIEGDGDYDMVEVFYNGTSVYKTEKKESYTARVPFVGERTFTPRLFHRNRTVAECNRLTIRGLNTPPELTGEFSKIITGRTGEPLTFSLADAVSDKNGDTLLFEMKHAPEGSILGPHTGEFTWTPEKSGYYLIEFYVYDYPHKTGEIWLQRMLTIE